MCITIDFFRGKDKIEARLKKRSMEEYIQWQQFGLRKNPYDGRPLIEGDSLVLDQAFIGRRRERQYMNRLIQSSERACIAVCGPSGVGKTSFVNMQKMYWKQHAKKRLFSFRGEMEAQVELLNKKQFLLEVMSGLLREIQLVDPGVLKHPVLRKVSKMVDLTQRVQLGGGLSVSALGFGMSADVRRDMEEPIQLSVTSIEQLFYDLVECIRTEKIDGKRYQGVMIHVDNFDVVLSESAHEQRVLDFFQEIRDLLQAAHVYYVCIGSSGFFRRLSKVPRVKAVFTPAALLLEPLSKKEMVQAVDTRMRLLQSPEIKEYITVFEDRAIHYLYELFEGDIRSIMTGLSDALGQYAGPIRRPLSAQEAIFLLAKERWFRIQNSMTFTRKRQEIVLWIVKKGGCVAVDDVAQQFQLSPAYTWMYYLKPLRNSGVLEEQEASEDTRTVCITKEFQPLVTFFSLYRAVK
jgi:hypothetical protein